MVPVLVPNGTSVPKHRRQEHFGTGLVPQHKIAPTTEGKKEYTGITVQISKYQPTQLRQQKNHQYHSLKQKGSNKENAQAMKCASSAWHTAHTAERKRKGIIRF
jgi:hypothetical protein